MSIDDIDVIGRHVVSLAIVGHGFAKLRIVKGGEFLWLSLFTVF